MAVIKNLINISGSNRQVLNRQLANNENYIIPQGQWAKAADSAALLADISAGLVLVNNGTSDLSIADALEWIKKYQTNKASEIVFTPTVDIIATNVQDAIEDARTLISSLTRFVITCTFNSTVGNNDWLGYAELLPGDQVPIRLPVKCRLKEIQFSYKNSHILGIPLGGDEISGRFDLYKNGYTTPTNVVYQTSFVNQVGGKYVTEVNIDLVPGDYMIGRWVDQGNNPSDMAITYFFEMRL